MATQSLQGEQATLIDVDPREVDASEKERRKPVDDELSPLVGWVVEKVEAWEVYRRTNFEHLWDEYERLWRGIYSSADRKRESERSRLIAPALSEAVENSAAELEEAIFGRGDFFEAEAENSDDPLMREAVAKNKAAFRDDLKRSHFVENVCEAVVNAAVFGNGIGEIVVREETRRDVVVKPDEMGQPMIAFEEKEVAFSALRSVNPRNFTIDPHARTVDEALGCAIEEPVGMHLIREGQERGEYRAVPLESAMIDPEKDIDPQMAAQYERDGIPVIRYYGLVPENLLFPADRTEKLFPEEDPNETQPGKTKMVEAVVVIVNRSLCLKAVENPALMQDRPIVEFKWDIVPGRFHGRGICEKGNTPQRLLDTELRSRSDALAYSSAPMMGLDSTRLPRGFQFKVSPGRSVLFNGKPSDIAQEFRFGSVDQSTWQQAQMLDQFVQRATGAIDAMTLAQRGVGGDARSGAVSMSLSGIVKRNKRTMIRFVDSFLGPALQKMLWRNMQYNPERYVPLNFTFNVTSTVGIMQREYEMASLTQLLGTMQPGSIEYLMILRGILENSGIQNREALLRRLEKQMQTMEQAQQMPAEGAAPLDPVQQQMQQLDIQLAIAEKQAQIAKAHAQARLYDAQARNEMLEPQFKAQEIATKGIYAVQENQDREFNRRMEIAKQMLKQADIVSNERIAQTQIQGSLAKAAINASSKAQPGGMLAPM